MKLQTFYYHTRTCNRRKCALRLSLETYREKLGVKSKSE